MNFDMSQLQSLLGEARKQYDELRQKMVHITVEGAAGAGMVTVKMSGDKQLLEVKLDPEVVKNDPDMLPDLIRAAVNDAARRVDEAMKSELGGLMGNLPMPGLF